MLEHFPNSIKTFIPFTLGSIFILIYFSEHFFPEKKLLIDHKHDLFNIFIGTINLAFVYLINC